MIIISKQGDPKLAQVYVAKFRTEGVIPANAGIQDDDFLAEFVDAIDPELSANEKWVIIVSTQFGCPAACPMCDAGGNYKGNLSADEILAQIDHVISTHPRKRLSDVKKFKIQFARMGEPALNPAVIEVINKLPLKYDAKGLIPCVATIAPKAGKDWFDMLLESRGRLYKDKPFQLQFSINSTDEETRDRMMPLPKLSLEEISAYADKFSPLGERKVSLNFALAEGVPICPKIIAKTFNPKSVCIKITPLNPTYRSKETGMNTALPPNAPLAAQNLCDEFTGLGYDVILSIGDERENQIGSNCGMAVRRMGVLM